ncbi:MAG: Crp/Fnr family transcriptional regulator [Rhodoferax sp.]|nr:MAG: Crp/Fnr family transcriptional regulator [Rhodoferax sp.]
MERSLRRNGDWTNAVFMPPPIRTGRSVTPTRYTKAYARAHGLPAQELLALRELTLFEGLEAEVQEQLARHASLRTFAKNQEIASAADMVSEFHFLVTGTAKVQLQTTGGRKKVVEIVRPGYNFDECMPMHAARQNLHVVAISTARVLSIPKEVVQAALEAHPPLAMRFIRSMSQRMTQLMGELNSHIFDNAMQRFVRYIVCQLVPASQADSSQAVTVTLPAGKAVVASRLSLSPEYFSRMLRQLETEHLIEIDNRSIAIPDLSRLISLYGPQASLRPL